MSCVDGGPMFAHDNMNVKTPENLSARQRDAKDQTIASEQPVPVLNPFLPMFDLYHNDHP